jgi:hypothetical protein
LPVASYQLPVTGYQLPVTGYWLPVTSYQLPVCHPASGILRGLSVLKTSDKYFRTDRRKIAYIRFIFEAYEGIAMMSTADARKGIIVFRIPPGCEAEADDLLSELRKEVLLIPVDEKGEENGLS